ncbi:hypothetical protein G3A44_22025 [Ideonella sp. TBM-1]|uniref:Uncharacterized protein n=1 Tax=Ideonella livida TaxID=2707176 RepID=A0A7C9PKZ4_9BURK|nr:hypothetical protein [Ideonella livida]NDY93874.1 hypothetical protein [Ideonella livida]
MIQEPRLWSDGVWTAKVIKDMDDDGWAVSMTLVGQAEPALVGPWTMGRDKKNPKPLSTPAFQTLVKTAHEVLRRHEQQRDAQLHQSVNLNLPEGRLTVRLDITPDEFEPYAELSAWNALDEELARVKVRPDFRLNSRSATAWVEGGFGKVR